MTVTTNYLVTGNGITGSTANAIQALVSTPRNGDAVKGDLLHRFTSAAALTGITAPVLSDSTSVRFEGAQTVRFLSPSAGTTAGVQVLSLNVPTRTSSFILLCFIPDWSKVSAVIPYISQGATISPNFVSYSAYSLTNDSHKYNGWHAIEISQDMWTATGTGVVYDGTTTKSLRVDVAPRAGQIAEVFFAAVYLNTWSMPSIMFTYDDGRISQYQNAFRLHKKNKIPMNCYVIPPLLGTAGQFTEANAQEIEAQGGSICNHAFYEGVGGLDSFSEIGLAPYVTQVEQCRDWLAARNFSGALHHAYVEGAYDETLAAEMVRIGMSTARTISGNNTTGAQSMTTAWGVHRRMALKGGLQFNTSRTVVNAKLEIDRAIRDGRSLIFTGHDVFTAAEGGTGALSWLDTDLEQIFDYVAAYRAKGQCLTPTLPAWADSLDLVQS